jgi:hypothetical protein
MWQVGEFRRRRSEARQGVNRGQKGEMQGEKEGEGDQDVVKSGARAELDTAWPPQS